MNKQTCIYIYAYIYTFIEIKIKKSYFEFIFGLKKCKYIKLIQPNMVIIFLELINPFFFAYSCK